MYDAHTDQFGKIRAESKRSTFRVTAVSLPWQEETSMTKGVHESQKESTWFLQGYSYDQRLENVDIDFKVPHTPIVGLGQ